MPNRKWISIWPFLNGGCLRSWLEQCWSGRTEVCSLYWLVRLPLKAGSHAYTLEQSNDMSTSQALRLANRNVSNRNSISINRTALPWVIKSIILRHKTCHISAYYHVVSKIGAQQALTHIYLECFWMSQLCHQCLIWIMYFNKFFFFLHALLLHCDFNGAPAMSVFLPARAGNVLEKCF